MRPNNSFNPNPLRSTNNMADKACHVVGSTTQVGLTQALGPEEQHVASFGSALLEALRDRIMRGDRSRVCLFAVHATSCAQRAGMGACCSSWGAGRFYPGIGIICLGVPAQSTCSYSWRSASDRGGLGCLVRAQGLTIHSSRHRFAARLNSGVRPCFPHCCRKGTGPGRSLRSSAAVRTSHARDSYRQLACGISASDRRDSPQGWTYRVGFGAGAVKVLGRAPQQRGFVRGSGTANLLGHTWCTVRRRGWTAARSDAGSRCGGLTMRSSRSRFVTQSTWQVQLAMCFAPLRVSA